MLLSFWLPSITLGSLSTLSLSVQAATPPDELYSSLISTKVKATADKYTGTYPQYTDHGNPAKWINFGADGWTTGFFPATLYSLHTRQTLCPAQSDEIDWFSYGRRWSQGMVPLQTKNGQGHDQGFLSFPFVEELKVNPKNTSAINAVNAFAKLLAARYNPVVGCTRSWNSADPEFQVIIDNMINLELLFVSAGLTGNKTLETIAISHADRTIKEHFRSDGSTYHVVVYNTYTGNVTAKHTSQGYADSSTWSRGQSWAIYGYANMYSRTKYTRYLDTARKAAKLYLSRLPSSYVVPWDFDAPKPAPADTSSAGVAANGLLYLAKLERSINNATGATYWTDQAIKLLGATAKLAWKPTWESLLSNGTVNNPAGNSLTGIVYGDYYWIEAGNELISQGVVACDEI